MEASGIDVEASGVGQGFPFEIAEFFPENTAIPIAEGAPQC